MHALRHNRLMLVLGALALAAPVAICQQQGKDQGAAPIPAYRSPLASAADNGDLENNPQELTPDTRPLAGARNLSLGIPAARSYWQPHFDIRVFGDSNAPETPTSRGWGAFVSLSGGVDVHRASENTDMTLGYTSGGMITNNAGAKNGVIQSLSFAEKLAFRRVSLSFFDNLNYLPEASLGFGGLPGTGLPGGGSSGMGSNFTVDQSILTGQGQNLGNSFVAEIDTSLTPRTSFTLVGGYSLLRYFDSDLLNSATFTFRGGYNHEISRNDTIAMLYTFTGYRYGNSSQSVDTHTAQVSYGRRVTGRLAFQIVAGPQLVVPVIPISGSTGSTGGGSGTTNSATEISWSLSSAVQWQAKRTALGLAYNHGTSAGSGVLAGSLSDVVTGTLTRPVSRTFSNGFNVGFSRNKGVTLSDSTPAYQTYRYWFAGGNLAHPMGRSLALTLSYQVQYQTSNLTGCTGPTCGANILRHLVSMGLGWHERPLRF